VLAPHGRVLPNCQSPSLLSCRCRSKSLKLWPRHPGAWSPSSSSALLMLFISVQFTATQTTTTLSLEPQLANASPTECRCNGKLLGPLMWLRQCNNPIFTNLSSEKGMSAKSLWKPFDLDLPQFIQKNYLDLWWMMLASWPSFYINSIKYSPNIAGHPWPVH
jgi:hypothetical protein